MSGGLQKYIYACWCLSSQTKMPICTGMLILASKRHTDWVLALWPLYCSSWDLIRVCWWVVIRRYNTSGSWPSNHNGESITGTADCNHTLSSQCALEMGNETGVEKLEVQLPNNDEFGQPCPHSAWSHSFFQTLLLFHGQIGFYMGSVSTVRHVWVSHQTHDIAENIFYLKLTVHKISIL